MSLILLSKILLILMTAIGVITTIMGFAGDRTRNSALFKLMLGMCSLVVVAYVSLHAYLEIINRDQVFADLTITIAEPYLVNIGGTETDNYVEDADFMVVSFNPAFSTDATIEIENVKTHEKMTYSTFKLGSGYTINNFGSGLYDIVITTSEYDVYKERILLDTKNLYVDESEMCWDFTAFMFDGFYDEAVNFDIYIGDVEDAVYYDVFGIECDGIYAYTLFNSDVDWERGGKLAGTFYGYKNIYYVHNCVDPSLMEAVEIDVTG